MGILLVQYYPKPSQLPSDSDRIKIVSAQRTTVIDDRVVLRRRHGFQIQSIDQQIPQNIRLPLGKVHGSPGAGRAHRVEIVSKRDERSFDLPGNDGIGKNVPFPSEKNAGSVLRGVFRKISLNPDISKGDQNALSFIFQPVRDDQPVFRIFYKVDSVEFQHLSITKRTIEKFLGVQKIERPEERGAEGKELGKLRGTGPPDQSRGGRYRIKMFPSLHEDEFTGLFDLIRLGPTQKNLSLGVRIGMSDGKCSVGN